MKLIKKIFILFCLLFIASVINEKGYPADVTPEFFSGCVHTLSDTYQDEVNRGNDGLLVCLRLAENSNSCFRNTPTGNEFFNAFSYKPLLFSNQSYSYYLVNRRNQSDSYPLYIHNRQLII